MARDASGTLTKMRRLCVPRQPNHAQRTCLIVDTAPSDGENQGTDGQQGLGTSDPEAAGWCSCGLLERLAKEPTVANPSPLWLVHSRSRKCNRVWLTLRGTVWETQADNAS